MAGTRFTVLVLVLLVGLIGFVSSRSIVDLLYPTIAPRFYQQLVAGMSISSGLFGLAAIVLIWKTLSRIDDYLDSSARLLRELFVRGATTPDLIRADNILRKDLRKFGPSLGIEKAEEELAVEFPAFLARHSADSSEVSGYKT